MAKINFGGVTEDVITAKEFPLKKAQKVLKKETVAVLGYGVQGPGQALNLRDNGIRVIVGQRKGTASWKKAVKDGFKPGVTLFPIEEAADKGTIVCYLLSDAGQKAMWPKIKPYLAEGKALYFSHGFSITYKGLTKVVPPPNIDVILVAPKGSGRNVRSNFLDGSGINSSFAVFQDYTGRALERTLAMGIAIGRVTSSRRPLRTRSTAISPANGASSWVAWRASWKRNTTVCANTATARARPSTRPWKN
jgi:ketol-acid reductoisomerase